MAVRVAELEAVRLAADDHFSIIIGRLRDDCCAVTGGEHAVERCAEGCVKCDILVDAQIGFNEARKARKP